MCSNDLTRWHTNQQCKKLFHHMFLFYMQEMSPFEALLSLVKWSESKSIPLGLPSIENATHCIKKVLLKRVNQLIYLHSKMINNKYKFKKRGIKMYNSYWENEYSGWKTQIKEHMKNNEMFWHSQRYLLIWRGWIYMQKKSKDNVIWQIWIKAPKEGAGRREW